MWPLCVDLDPSDIPLLCSIRLGENFGPIPQGRGHDGVCCIPPPPSLPMVLSCYKEPCRGGGLGNRITRLKPPLDQKWNRGAVKGIFTARR